MPWRRISNALGGALLFAVFLAGVLKQFGVGEDDSFQEERTIFLFHPMEGEEIQSALESVVRLYEEQNPGWHIKPTHVPIKTYPMWIKTKLPGESPPDIVGIARISQEDMMNYLHRFTTEAEQPNPYNVGTPLEGIPWRETFLNGLESSFNALEDSRDVVGTSHISYIDRFIYNKDLLRRLTGDDRIPDNLEEFLEFASNLKQHSEFDGYVIAGDSDAPYFFRRFLNQITQEFAMREPSLRANSHMGQMRDYLRGDWQVDSSPIRESWEIISAFGSLFQSGFLYASKDERIFKFLAGQALMMPMSSVRYGIIAKRAPFQIGLFRLPSVDPSQSRYGKLVYGPLSERSNHLSMTLGVVARSPKRAQALDFLMFLTSYEGASLFSRESLSISGVEVPVPEELRDFAPVLDGWPSGISQIFVDLNSYSPDVGRLVRTNLHLLFDQQSGVDAFFANIVPKFEDAVRSDLQRIQYKEARQRGPLRDVQLLVEGAEHQLGSVSDGELRIARQRSSMADFYQNQWALADFSEVEATTANE